MGKVKNNKKIYKTFLENQKKDIYFVLFSDTRKLFPKKCVFVSIIEIYGTGAKKIFFILLR